MNHFRQRENQNERKKFAAGRDILPKSVPLMNANHRHFSFQHNQTIKLTTSKITPSLLRWIRHDVNRSEPMSTVPKEVFMIMPPELAKYKNIHRSFSKVASFNWYMDHEKNPVLVVPGRAKRYDVEWKGGQLNLDFSKEIVNKNHYALEHGMDYFFHAIKACAQMTYKWFNCQEYDIATDANNLEMLFNLVTNECNNELAFRIEVERVGKLIVFNFPEQSVFAESSDAGGGHPVRIQTYGLDYEEKCSKVPDDEFCHGLFYHINDFKFFDLNLLVGSFVDCADYGKSNSEDGRECCEDGSEQVDGSTLKIIKRGCCKSYANVELITRSRRRGFPSNKYAAWFFSNMRTVDLGYHDRGFVQERKVVDFKSVCEFQPNFVPKPKFVKHLCRLYRLLKHIVDLVRKRDVENEESRKSELRKFVLIFDKNCDGKLQIYEIPMKSEKRSCISPAVRNFVAC